MPLENLLQLNIAALVAMGSLLLGMGQNNHLLPMFAVGSAVVSVFLTDFWRIIRLNTIVANIAGILAVVFCLSDFFEFEHKQEQLFAVANLLVYLQRHKKDYHLPAFSQHLNLSLQNELHNHQ